MRMVFIFFAVVTAAAVHAEPNDKNCRNFAGVRINTPECIEFFKQRPTDIECAQSEACTAEAAARAAARRAEADELRRKQDEAIAKLAGKKKYTGPASD